MNKTKFRTGAVLYIENEVIPMLELNEEESNGIDDNRSQTFKIQSLTSLPIYDVIERLDKKVIHTTCENMLTDINNHMTFIKLLDDELVDVNPHKDKISLQFSLTEHGDMSNVKFEDIVHKDRIDLVVSSEHVLIDVNLK